MKKILSLVLVLSLVLGSFPMAFAAEVMDEKTPGEVLKGYEMISGDENGNLNEEGKLTRAAMMKLIAAMMGVEEEAKNYPLPSTFTDVPADAWYAGYVAYAQNAKWSNGIGDGLFAPEGEVTAQMAAKFMLSALGYEVNWATAVEDAAAQGIMTGVEVPAEQAALRGQVFQMMVNTLEQNKAGTDVKLGVDLGVIKPEAPEVKTVADVEFDVKAISFEKVEVTFKADVDADAAANVDSYKISEKSAADNTLEVVSVEAQGTNEDDEAVYVLMTEEQKEGRAYTLTIDKQAKNFTGLEEEKSAPKVDDVEGSDTNTVEIEFDMVMDKATAEDVANYSIAKVEILNAELDDDRKMVTLTTDGMAKKANRKVTIENVESVNGVEVKKVTKSFVSDIDNKAPKVEDVVTKKSNNVKVYIQFEDDHNLDKASAEDLSNYSISGLDILSAEYFEKDEDADGDNFEDKWDVVVLTTEEQTKSKYTVKINDVIDGSVSENAMTKEVSETFRSGDKDEDEPKVDDATAHNGDELYVKFDEDNNLDPASALDIDNYEVEKDELDILDARFKDNDEDSKTIILTTSQQDKDERYELVVKNIEDEYGNVLKDDTERFDGSAADFTAPEVKGIRSYIDDGDYKVDVTFVGELNEASAEDPTNYVIDEGIGAALKASYDDDDSKYIVTLTIPTTDDNKEYELTITNVEDRYDNIMKATDVTFYGAKDGDDTKRPEIDDVESVNNREIRITFTEDMVIAASAQLTITNTDVTPNTTTTAAFVTLLDDEKVAVFMTKDELKDDDYDFAINDGSEFEDKSGNTMEDEELTSDFKGDADKPEDLEIDKNDYDQLTAKKFEFEVSEEFAFKALLAGDVDKSAIAGVNADDTFVKLASEDKDSAYANYEDDTNAIKAIERDSDDPMLFTIEFEKPVPVEKFLKFNMETIIKPVNGLTDIYASNMDEYVVETDDEDETAPILESVEATDNKTVEVIYDEDMSKEGRYEITYKDDDDKTQEIDIEEYKVDDNKIVLTLKDTLDGDETYDLVVKSGAKDLAGNREETEDDDEFAFDGTDKTPQYYITGVDLVNGSKVVVYTNEDVAQAKNVTMAGVAFDVSASTVSDASGTLAEATDEITLVLEDGYTFDKDVDYTVEVEGFGSYKFEGILDDGGIDVVFAGTAVSEATITFGDFDDEDGYSMQILSDDNNITEFTVDALNVTDANIADNADIAISAAALTVDTVKVVFEDGIVKDDAITVNVLDDGRVVYTKEVKAE